MVTAHHHVLRTLQQAQCNMEGGSKSKAIPVQTVAVEAYRVVRCLGSLIV
jgi:hypothetical protein